MKGSHKLWCGVLVITLTLATLKFLNIEACVNFVIEYWELLLGALLLLITVSDLAITLHTENELIPVDKPWVRIGIKYEPKYEQVIYYILATFNLLRHALFILFGTINSSIWCIEGINKWADKNL